MIRISLLAGLWGLPGPIAVGVIMAVCLGHSGYHWQAGVISIASDAFHNVSSFAPYFAYTACIGFTYGVLRFLTSRTGWRFASPRTCRGSFLGTLVWTFTGVPFLAFIAMILLMHLLFGFERMNWIAALSQTVGPFCMLVGHIVGGAIAGFHIDYFLLNVAPNP